MENKNKGFLNLLHEREFTARDTMHLILYDLYHKGVKEINEEEFAKKLYAYYVNPEYKGVIGFPHFIKKPGEDRVDLADSMFFEKYYSDNISWARKTPKILHLNYENVLNNEKQETDVEKLITLLGEENIELIDQLTTQLALNYQVERESIHNLNIYSFDPNNRSYTLASGQFDKQNHGWELITDGNIKSQAFDQSKNIIDPSGRYYVITLRDGVARKVELKDATYAIMQGTRDSKLGLIHVYTNIQDLSKLKTISGYASQIHQDPSSLLVSDKPYVRKLLLK